MRVLLQSPHIGVVERRDEALHFRGEHVAHLVAERRLFVHFRRHAHGVFENHDVIALAAGGVGGLPRTQSTRNGLRSHGRHRCQGGNERRAEREGESPSETHDYLTAGYPLSVTLK